MSEFSSSPDEPVIRILLMGRNGSGKSSSGNTILGKKKFKVHIIHQKKHEAEDKFGDICEEKVQMIEKQIYVIDSPDLLNPKLSKETFESMKEQLVSQCSAGLSAVLLVVPLVINVENEEEILDFIKCLFGPEVQKYIMILFTHGDELEDLDETIDEHLQNHADLQQLVTDCEGKFHCFNNKCKSNDQIQELLQKIEGMVMKNRGKFNMAKMRRRASKNDPCVIFSGESPADDPVRKDQIRLILLGKTGSGKSSTGNTIIGRNVFKSSASSKSQTIQCQAESTVRMGKEISVIDTPGLYDTLLSKDESITEILKCITYSVPGPHAFIIIIRVGRFTEEEKNTIKELKDAFGEQILKYTMILFTHKDQLEEENKTIEQFLQNGDSDVRKLVDACRNQFCCLDNKSASFPQFKDILRKIEMMVAENGGHFTNGLFEGTEKLFQKQKLDENLEHLGLAESFYEKDLITDDERVKALAELFRNLGDNIDSMIGVDFDPVINERMIRIIQDELGSILKETGNKRMSYTETVQLTIQLVRATGKIAKLAMCKVQ